MLRIQDIMTTDVVTVAPSTTLRDAAELFARRHVGGAPVVDGNRLVGVVSVSDILDFAATAGSPDETSFFTDRWSCSGTDADSPLDRGVEGEASALDGHTVADVMNPSVLALPPGADLAIAAERMRLADVHRLLVVEHGSLVGILSTTDLARAVVADRSPRTGRAISIRTCTTSIPPS